MFLRIMGCLWLAAVCCLTARAEETAKWPFEDAKEGQLPDGWTAAKTGEGPGSEWKVVAFDDSSKKGQALAQVSSEGPRPLYNLCVLAKEKRADVDLSVSVRAVKGEIDQGGGLVWRYRDANNYYITRWNPLETNFRVYHVVAGKRTQLATADVTLPADEWHTVRAVQSGNHIQCYLDGKLLLDVKDETLKDAGAVGLWSKADAVTWFDNLTIATPAK
jgi:hypothetical protein